MWLFVTVSTFLAWAARLGGYDINADAMRQEGRVLKIHEIAATSQIQETPSR